MASNLDSHRQTIEERIEDSSALATYFRTIHQDPWKDVAVSWPGAPFQPPNGPWIQVTIVWGDGFIETMGSSGGANRVVGVVNVNVFDYPDIGLKRVHAIGEIIRDLFNRNTVSGIRFEAPSGFKPVPEAQEGWIGRNVTIPFEVEETV